MSNKNTTNTKSVSNTSPGSNTTSVGSKNNSKSSISIPNNNIVAPSINNKSQKSTTISNSKTTVNNDTTFQTAKEETGVYEVVSTNYMLLIAIASALIIILIIYLFSQSFRVGRAVNNMSIYQGYQQISSLNIASTNTFSLGNYYVASAYNAAHSGYQMYDYTSEKIVLSLLQSGVRYLEFNIFNSEFGDKAFPVVSMGYMVGEWKMTINDTPLETIFEIIDNNAFKISEGEEGVNNPDDPLIIGLKLNTNSNLNCLNLIGFLIVKYFGKRLLDSKYSFQQSDDIASIKMSKLVGANNSGGKVIIFASDGFQGSGLDEVVNYSWDNINNNPKHKMKRLLYTDIVDPTYNKKSLIEFNKTGLTIIVNHIEGDFFNDNYDPTIPFELGCQLVAMEYQSVDSNMDIYMKSFKYSAFVLKGDGLR
jgi:hypothetical protein